LNLNEVKTMAAKAPAWAAKVGEYRRQAYLDCLLLADGNRGIDKADVGALVQVDAVATLGWAGNATSDIAWMPPIARSISEAWKGCQLELTFLPDSAATDGGRGANTGAVGVSPTPLRCSPSGRVAELTAFGALFPFKQLRRVS
jgi:hypothetical protein